MTGESDKSGAGYRVGHGKPPRSHRWPKGKSGNPRGRPPRKHIPALLRNLDPVSARVLEQADRTFTVRTADGERTISQYDALLERLFKLAMGGNFPAIMANLEMVQRAHANQRQLLADSQQAAHLHHERYGLMFEQAEKAGKPVPRVLPHPRDIIIDLEDPDMPVKIVGPVNWSEQAEMEAVLQCRDELDRRLQELARDENLTGEMRDLLVPLLKERRNAFNAALPPRLQRPR